MSAEQPGGNWWNNQNIWGGLGNIGSGIANMFQSNPADAAKGYLNQIPGEMGGYLNPYINNGNQAYGYLQPYMQRGNNAGNMLMGQYGAMTSNPGQFMNQIGQGFQQSPGYEFEQSQALGQANRAAAAGGMAGSPAEQQQIAGVSGQIANQDYYNYLNHAMDMFGQGMNGLQNMSGQGMNAAQNVYNTGYNASSDMANSLADYYMSQGNLGYAGAQNQNNSMLGGLGSLASGLGSLFSF